MAYRASPPRRVPEMAKAAVAAVEVPGVDFTEADFVSISSTGVTHQDGYASGVYAVLPDKHAYDKLRWSFTVPEFFAADNTATLTLFARLSDGEIINIGESVLNASNLFPSFEVENYDARYFLAVTALGGTTPTVSVTPVVQGVYDDDD